MNARERKLLLVLLAILGTGIAGYGVKRWCYDPLVEHNAAIEKLAQENKDLDEQLATFQAERRKLTLARLRSLPANPEQAAAQYMAYLQPVLNKSGLAVDELSHSTAQKLKPLTAVPNVKEVGHQVMTFTVRAKGELAQLVKALDQLQKTPYEHRIRSLTVDRADMSAAKKDASPKLSIQIIIETLLVAKTENKPGLPPGFSPAPLAIDLLITSRLGYAPIDFGMIGAVLQLKQTLPQLPADRDYADIARKNIFVGAIPIPPKVIVKIKENEPPPPVPVVEAGPEPPEDNIPSFVYLTQTIPSEQTAYLRNRIYRTPEMKLVAKAQSGYDTFRITDDTGDYVYFRAKVLKVELRQVFLQIKNQVYSVQIGQSLAEMKELSFNLTRIELEDLGLYDREFAAKEMEKDKKNKKDNKGKTTKGRP